MQIKKFIAATSLAALTTLSLAACGDDSDSDSDNGNPLQTSETTEGGTETTDDGGMETTDGGTDPMGGEVSREDYTQGIREIIAPAVPGLSETDLDTLAQCITLDSYDKVSPETRESVANGVDVTTGEDGQILFDVAESCASGLSK